VYDASVVQLLAAFGNLGENIWQLAVVSNDPQVLSQIILEELVLEVDVIFPKVSLPETKQFLHP
jgi:hypothetical protein